MKVFNLQCTQSHRFEGWFGSEDDYQSQLGRGLIECPLCGDAQVQRLPAAPRLNLGGFRADAVPAVESAVAVSPGAEPTGHPAMQALWVKAVRHVLTHTEDVGWRFAEEARRMHYGESESRGIRGRTTAEEARALDDEGIEVFSLPVPEALKGPVQ